MTNRPIPYLTRDKRHVSHLEFLGHQLLEAGRQESEIYGRRQPHHLFRYHETWFGREVSWQLGTDDEYTGLRVTSRPRSLTMDLSTSQNLKDQWPQVIHSIGHLTTSVCYLESYDEANPSHAIKDFFDPGSPSITYFQTELADFIDRSGLILVPFEPPIVGYNRQKFDKG